MEFFVSSDLVHGGYDETGYPLERLIYYVIAEMPDGRRFAHRNTFNNEREATVLMRLFERVYLAGRRPNPDFWMEIDPAYGSEAYQRLDDQKFFRNREIMDAYDAGEISEREAIDLTMR